MLESNPSPLRGLRVVEMTEALAGPYCAMLLGDLGAEVIKVERPGTGDQSRGWGPPFLDGESAYYLAVNRNKRSLELDIKQEHDLALLHRLLERSDVFITNNPRMESLERAALDPGTLRALNPGLVYAAISGYGHSGPKAGRAGYDVIAQGEAGLMAVTGGPEDGPIRFPTPMADISAGIYTLIGILAALYNRDRPEEGSGAGQLIDVALVDSQVTWLANLGGSFFATGERPAKMGNVHPSITPYQPLRARDKELIVAVGTERLWERLCAVLEVEESLGSDPRYASNRRRNEHRGELVAALEEVLARRDAGDWVERLVAAGVPAGPINFPDHTLRDEQLAARGMIVELEHPLLGLVRSIGNPVHLAATPPTYRRHPPRLGEHNEEVRAELAGEPAVPVPRPADASVGDNRPKMAAPTRILVVEDNPVTAEVLERRLTERGYLVLPARDGEEALASVAEQLPDLVLLDLMLPTVDGKEVLRELRRQHPASDLPVVVLTVKEGSDDVVEALRLGANDYVTKTVDFSVILARIETQLSLRRMTAKVRQLAARDPLTGLFNRRGFYELAEKEESRARRYKTPLHALMIDLDNFKSINDRFGHKIGDHVLVEAARRMRQALRASDILGRWGGEEFAALLPGVTAEGALQTAERLRALVESNPIETTAGEVAYTVSVGVASFDGSCANLSDLLAHGDIALYSAKRGGRNRVEAHDPRQSTPRPD